MKAGSIKLQKIFEQTIRYQIPLFQRPYVWSERENWRPLWNDVRSLSERLLRTDDAPPHFLGAIVLDQVANQTGEIESRQVIDGQQRLTTLQLMIAAFRDLASANDLSMISKRFDKLITNDESFVVEHDDVFKVWPTNRDRDSFRKTLRARSRADFAKAFRIEEKEKKLEEKIPGAYLFFCRSAESWLRQEIDDSQGQVLGVTIAERFDALWTIVKSHLLLVAIDLEDDDDAQVIFETLNARGTQLLPADLVKNFLFQMGEDSSADLDQLYESYWKRFDSDFWREEIRQGRLKRPRIDLFLHHYLTLKTMDEVPVAHIFSYFKKYVHDCNEQGIGRDQDGGAAAYHLEQLMIYGKIFQQFLNPKPETFLDDFFHRLGAVDTATVYPFLLEAFHDLSKANSRVELKKILRDIESFLVRRLICGLTTKNYNRLFLDMIRNSKRGGQISAAAVRAFLQKLDGDSVRWPANRELREAILDDPLYRKLSQKKMRMLLLAFEKQMEDGETESVVYTDSKKLTIEHIMPQAWEAHWPLPFEEYPDDDEASLTDYREEHLHTIGNLTLLTNKLNPSLSAKDWDYKKTRILAASKMNLNRQYFVDIDVWDEAEIYERSKSLARMACKIWRFPKSETKSSALESEGEE